MQHCTQGCHVVTFYSGVLPVLVPAISTGSITPPAAVMSRCGVTWRLWEEGGRRWWTSWPRQLSLCVPTPSQHTLTMAPSCAVTVVAWWRVEFKWLVSRFRSYAVHWVLLQMGTFMVFYRACLPSRAEMWVAISWMAYLFCWKKILHHIWDMCTHLFWGTMKIPMTCSWNRPPVLVMVQHHPIQWWAITTPAHYSNRTTIYQAGNHYHCGRWVLHTVLGMRECVLAPVTGSIVVWADSTCQTQLR